MNYQGRVGVYNQKVGQYRQSGMRARDALQRGYSQAQAQLSDVYRSGAFQTQQQGLATREAIGRIAARGQSGRSAALSAQNALSAYGRNQAILAQSLLGAQNRYAYDVEGLRQQYQSNRANAYSDVAIAPRLGAAPVAPRYAQGPSSLGLVADLGQAAIGGFQTYSNLKADNVFDVPPPKPEPLPPA